MSCENIFIVEDDPVITKGLQAQLLAQGYQVTSLATIADAMRALRVQWPDLLILDLTVLDDDPFGGLTDGFAFLQMLRRNFPEADFPVIIHSIDDSPKVQARAQECGVYAIVKKGTPISELLNIIRTALDERINAAASA